MSGTWSWRRLQPEEVGELRREPVDRATLDRAGEIVERVRDGGEPALRHLAERLDGLGRAEPLAVGARELRQALAGLPGEDRLLLERTGGRIAAFARLQRAAVRDVEMAVPGGRAGQRAAPVAVAGCYAPGGRHPLPSSVLMTAVTARVAGVETVWVASPRPTPITLAAAAVAGADGLLRVGGAQAVAAMAYGVGPVPRCDVIVGPGNRWVTAAKKIVMGTVGIDMLAGPSELVILSDGQGDPALVAADLLAQAEHDPEALPVLVTTEESFAAAVELELGVQLGRLRTREVAAAALARGFVVVARDLEEAAELSDRLAPEHLQVVTADPERVSRRLRHYGALFLGAAGGEVLGDYGAGPNHTLPTGGSARFAAGLSVHHFLRQRTWLRIDDAEAGRELVADAVALAEAEGLTGHAEAARRRLAP